jgi:hypothetical protein
MASSETSARLLPRVDQRALPAGAPPPLSLAAAEPCASSDKSPHVAEKRGSFITTQGSDALRGRDEGSDPTLLVEPSGRGSGAVRTRAPRRLPALLAPLGRRGWDCDDVAAHLMQRREPIVRGLAHRTPWSGIKADTLNGLYSEAAAIISRIAASQYRRDWRTHADLERAVIAAFRHQALHHWRSVNAAKRRGDRDAVEFDPERHARSEEVLASIFDANPHEELVARDWLAQLDGEVRQFWRLLLDGVSFTDAGDRLGLSYAQSKVHHRAGLEQFARFRALQEAGKVCHLRAGAIAAYRSGTADAITAERAQAHLACCLACALVHDRQASAVTRGLFHVLPLPAVARAFARLRDVFADRAAEATAGGATGVGGALLLGNGATTALLCAGALAGGACVAGLGPIESPFPSPHPHHAARPHVVRDVAAAPSTPRSSALAVAPLTTSTPSSTSSSPPTKPPAARASEFGPPRSLKRERNRAAAMTQAQAREFDPESQSATTATSPSATAASTTSPSTTTSSTSSSSTTAAPSSPTPRSASSTSTPEFGGP